MKKLSDLMNYLESLEEELIANMAFADSVNKMVDKLLGPSPGNNYLRVRLYISHWYVNGQRFNLN